MVAQKTSEKEFSNFMEESSLAISYGFIIYLFLKCNSTILLMYGSQSVDISLCNYRLSQKYNSHIKHHITQEAVRGVEVGGGGDVVKKSYII